jgi:hypothetical protein
MFSVDDPLIRHQWTVSLKREIDAAISSAAVSSASLGTSKFHRAAERTAFKVLQETLIGTAGSSGPFPSSVDKALDRLTMSPRTLYTPVDTHSSFDQRRGAQTMARNGHRNSHVRSKSRSQIYHKQGAGRLELDLSQSSYGSLNSFNTEDRGRAVSTIDYEQEFRAEGRLWSGRDLEMHCQQNSSVALVLACV